MAISSAAAGSRIKFLNPARRPQSTDISAGVAWGVAATTTALWLIQPFEWIKKTFLEKSEPQK